MKSTEILKKLNLSFLGQYNDSDLKRMKKKIKEAKKDITNGRKRNFYLAEYIPTSKIVEFVELQNEYFYAKLNEKQKEATDFLMNEEKALEYRFYTEKYENEKQKEAQKIVEGMECPEDTNKVKFKRKQLQKELKKLLPEQTDENVANWADKAYLKVTDELWELEVEEALLALA